MTALNAPQREAIRYIDSPLLVLAGAGSGKTRVITHKIAYLIQDIGMNPKNIAAVTFTNKAAREMKARVSQLLNSKETRGLTVSTFHTLGLNIVRKSHKALGYKTGMTIMDSQDSAGILRDLLDDDYKPDKDFINTAQHTISRWKNALILPEEALAQANHDTHLQIAQLYANYQKQLKAYNAVDFDDLIALPVLLFTEHPDIREQWQNELRYLLVDEYQDTNTSQYQLVRLITGVRGALTVVGDDDQSIYAWRGAQPENLQQLTKDYPRLKIIKLEQNYRSSNRILRAANRLIANNPHTIIKQLWSEKGLGDEIRVLCARDDNDEAERVVSELIRHKFQHRTQFKDYAILYRGNHQSRLFEEVLRTHRIPYYISGGTSFFARTEIKDIMAYLRLLVNHDDDAAFIRIANTPRREIGTTTLEKLGTYANSRRISLVSASFELGLESLLNSRALFHLRHFTRWVIDMGYRAQREAPATIAREVVTLIGYKDWLRNSCNDVKTADNRMENVEELLSWLAKLGEQEKNLTEIVSHITLMDMLERQNEENEMDSVALMTLHAAKGLEFPHVFIVGMEENLLPHQNSTDEASILEERRLAYVGITRAQKSLIMTLTQKRRRYGEMIDTEPSRFLQELPAEDLLWEGMPLLTKHPHQRQSVPKTEAEKKATGAAHMAHLRAMLEKK
ncbi:DNA helicase Rep [Beggiatoa leptomitoformis]|uniref:ATP-dependent DNA helicase Rep n=1 Tax=Beggiatoa leptomitoformis TaxID=288004 RepID=A0A2N9YHN3_9GAMM|nr:DNA helicase Rep [Beggiatoa leptomitoformis]ALG67700.1 DNA helicase Rep [Beggiatoa leptomitoformis]AUI70061.1 DNA helicase Rep [Beggiatoa leptomitoformis]